jgi:hypothetical protein
LNKSILATDEVAAEREGRKITLEDEIARTLSGEAEAAALATLILTPPRNDDEAKAVSEYAERIAERGSQIPAWLLDGLTARVAA